MKKIAALGTFFLFFFVALIGWNSCYVQAAVENDSNMKTEKYDVDIVVEKDGSYTVTEKIKVHFLNPRHGIYRYIPYKGKIITYDKDKTKHSMVYYAGIDMEDSNIDYDKSEENGNVVLRFGSEDVTVSRATYKFSYRLTPTYQGETYNRAYFNIFPTQWKNKIPAGSSFKIHFPKKTDLNQLYFYEGAYGDATQAGNDIRITKDDKQDVISGTLQKDFNLGSGMTCYGQLGDGYFTGNAQPGLHKTVFAFSMVLLIFTLFAFFKFGKDEKIIPSIQYHPPEGLDSAAVGYIIDGSVENRDIVSLILYWADHGNLRIQEKKKGKVTLIHLKDLPKNTPKYQKLMFNNLFEKKKSIEVASMEYKFADTMELVKDKIQYYYKHKIYTHISSAVRVVAFILSLLPLITFWLMIEHYHLDKGGNLVLGILCGILYVIALFLGCRTVDQWYSITSKKRRIRIILVIALMVLALPGYGSYYFNEVSSGNMFDFCWVYVAVALISLVCAVCTIFMKKRTSQCVQWMGYLAGLRDFIETAELDRMRVLAQDHPDMFYHILPYASVFGLFDIYAKKLDALSIPAPSWYDPYVEDSYFRYGMLNHCINHTVAQTLSVPEPSESGSNSDGFSGGDFGGGGFSGGGFGGGGGGSW